MIRPGEGKEEGSRRVEQTRTKVNKDEDLSPISAEKQKAGLNSNENSALLFRRADSKSKAVREKTELFFKNVNSLDYINCICRVIESLGGLKGGLNVYAYVSENQSKIAPAKHIIKNVDAIIERGNQKKTQNQNSQN